MGEYCLKHGNELLLKMKYRGKLVTLYMKVEVQHLLAAPTPEVIAEQKYLSSTITAKLSKPIFRKENKNENW